MVMTRIAQFIGDFKRANSGALLVQSALALIPLVAVMGIAVDAGRGYLYRSQLQGAVDAAALAGGREFHSTTRADDVRSFFYANMEADFMGGQVTDLDVEVVDEDTKTLRVDAAGTIPVTFMSLLGFNDMDVSASAESTSKTTGLQVVLVLDATGSMAEDTSGSRGGSPTKMTLLKDAATTLVAQLFGSETSSDTLSIGIVPYVTTVNVGSLIDSSFIDTSSVPGGYALDTGDPVAWNGCVEARATNAALDGSAYDVKVDHDSEDWVPFLWPPHYDNPYGGDPSWPVALREGPRDEVWDAPGEPGVQSNWSDKDVGPNINCPAPILDLTGTKSDIDNYLTNSLEYSNYKGGTIANLGMIWGWRLLHPDDPFDNAIDYDDSETVKAIVLMTDGKNWVVNSDHPYYNGSNNSTDNDDSFDDDGDNRCPSGCPTSSYDDGDEELGDNYARDSNYSGYGRLDDRRLGASVNTSGESTTEINRRLAHVCSGAKGRGIIVYTITFGSGATDTTLRNLYQGCATDTAKYFHAPNSTVLQSAFQSIANDLSELRISR